MLLSSHLISEMALTADWLVVIGRGRLVAELSMQELTSRAPRSVRVRTPEPQRFGAVLARSGIPADPRSDGSLSITGVQTDAVARLAAAADIVLLELTPEHPSLEDVFMALTHDSVVFHPGGVGNDAAGADPRGTRERT